MSQNRYVDHIEHRGRDHIRPDHIQYVIENPEIITADSQHDMRECYYASNVMDDYPQFYLKVVVDFSGSDGRVVTAFEVDRPKPTERVVCQPQH